MACLFHIAVLFILTSLMPQRHLECGNISSIKFDEAIKETVQTQIKKYPKSHLIDLYKNFFQDRFGPGHMINDTASAAEYLRSEIKSMNNEKSELDCLAEPTGYNHNFYRVDLRAITIGKISFKKYFDTFIESVNSIEPPNNEQWIEEWHKIKNVIDNMHLNLPNYKTETDRIEESLYNNNYIWHHSSEFNKTYSPHYRIISKEIFEREIRPLLQKGDKRVSSKGKNS